MTIKKWIFTELGFLALIFTVFLSWNPSRVTVVDLKANNWDLGPSDNFFFLFYPRNSYPGVGKKF